MSAFLPARSERAARAALQHFAWALPDTARAEIGDKGAAETWNRLAVELGGALRDYDAETELAADARMCAFVMPGDPQWPSVLDELGSSAPLGMWSQRAERLPDLTARSVFVAGNRHATPAGKRASGLAAAELTDHGASVVTISSWGVGSSAIGGVLSRQAAGVLVMPCGFSKPFPDGSSGLSAHLLANGGAMVSLQRPHAPASGASLATAPPLAAALARLTLVIESRHWDADSITAHAVGAARETGRLLLALDTRADDAFNPGNTELINDGIAQPASSAHAALPVLPPTDASRS